MYLTTGHICFYAYLPHKEVSLSHSIPSLFFAYVCVGRGDTIWFDIGSGAEDETVLSTLVHSQGCCSQLVSQLGCESDSVSSRSYTNALVA